MNVGLLIKEGQVGRKILPVEKLKINNIGGSESYWIPEETAEVDSLDVSENGLYFAINDDLDGYDQVNVNVPPDMDDDDIAKGRKITGTGDDGNDYAYGLDEDGNLTVEQIPAAIHIVVPPRKLKYEEGETLDFTGIHVYLMDGNNKRYTDDDYPTGEIPFDELMFPVTIAEGEGESGEEYSDGDGINAIGLIGRTNPKPGGSNVTFGNVGGYEIGCTSITAIGLELLVTIYNNEVYLAGGNLEEGQYCILGTIAVRTDDFSWLSTGSVGRKFQKKWPVPTDVPAFAWAPVSTKDPKNIDPDDLKPCGIEIPVQWMRSDGEILEDTFEIEIVSEEQPVPAPQPDPWAGYADVSWGGHHYNFNRRLVPPVQYSNGYCWRQQAGEYIVEYTVEQAASMGWLILIR